jgi:hypothetical protein
MTTPPQPKPKGYPGRPELDAANARFRRALARLHREGSRHDPSLLPQFTEIVGEATEHLLRLAGDAEAAEANSARHRKALAEGGAKLARQMKRAGMTVPARLRDGA